MIRRGLLYGMAAVLCALESSAQSPKSPYPIFFVHGLNSDASTWSDVSNAFGGDMIVLDYCLNHDGDSSVAILEDDTAFVGWRSLDGAALDGPTESSNGIYAVNFDNELFSTEVQSYHATHSLSNQSAIYKQGCALGVCIRKILEVEGVSKIVLVGHSMGGLAIREYLQREESGSHSWWVEPADSATGHKILKAVTIGTPHRGSNFNILDGELFGIIELSESKVWSEAVRDLRYYNSVDPEQYAAVYLFGGSESLLSTQYYNRDVNCDGDTTDDVIGINEPSDGTADNGDMPLPENILYTWITSDVGITDDDRIVALSRQWIYEGTESAPLGSSDTLLTDRVHSEETSDSISILRGLDEPGSTAFAFSVPLGEEHIGRMNVGPDYEVNDEDLFSFEVERESRLAVLVDGQSTGVAKLEILDSTGSPVAQDGRNSLPISLEYSAQSGTYFLRISGQGTNETLLNPYRFDVGMDLPSVESVTPLPYSHGVNRNSDIEIVFDVDLEPSTVGNSTLSVNGELGGRLAGDVEYESGFRTVRFSPSVQYDPGEEIVLSLSSDIRSSGGAKFLRGFQTEFRTESSPVSMVLGSASTDSLEFREAYCMVSADFDGDGHIDIALTSSGPSHVAYSNVSIHENDGAGGFALVENISIGAYRLSAGDFDADGSPDLAVSSTNNSVAVLLNSGTGLFSVANSYDLEGSGGTYIAVGDITNDGDMDIIAASGDYLTTLENDGYASFDDTMQYSFAQCAKGVSLADFDLDGDLDIAVSSSAGGSGIVTVFYNDGWGRMESTAEYSAGNYTTSMTTYDFDQDGDPDILQVGGGGYYDGVILKNSGDGTFLSQNRDLMPHVANTPFIIAKNVDGQDHVEMIQGDVEDSELVITTPAQSFNSFSYVGSFSVPGFLSWVSVADFDGDGDLDFLVLDGSATTISLLANEGEPLAVQVLSFRAESEQDRINLHWHVASEINVSHFEVTRKRLETEDEEWQKTASLSARGTAFTPKEYSLHEEGLPPGLYAYRLTEVERNGSSKLIGETKVRVLLPNSYSLERNYPNPFNGATTIRYSLPVESNVRLEVFNLVGQHVAVIHAGNLKSGYHTTSWTTDLSTGVYVLRLRCQSLSENLELFTAYERIVLLK